MHDSLKHKTVNSLIWRVIEHGGRQIVTFVISLILARLIMPDQFGLVAMLTVFTAVANVFIDSGFSSALIRKNNRTQEDCSTVYWFNIIVAICCYVIIFFGAPLVSEFYGIGELTSILRVSSLGLIIGSFVGVHIILLNAELDFKTLTKFNLGATLFSGIIGIVLAFLNFKVWALVFQGLSQTLLNTIMIFFKVKWRPSFIFSKSSFYEFFGFGSKLLISSILNTVYNNVYAIVIGKVFKASDLAFYNRATSFTAITSAVPTGVIQSVTYPTLCKLQDNDNNLKNAYRRLIKMSAFVVFPLCLGVGAVSYPLINILLTEVWIYSASLLSIIVFSLMWYPIHAINLNYLIVKGKSNLFLRLEVIKKIQGVIILCITIPFGLQTMCWGMVVSSLLNLIWNTYYTKKFLNMGILDQLYDLFPILILCAFMYAASRLTAIYLGNDIVSLIVSVLIGVVIYVGGALIFKFPEVKEILNLRK